MKVAHGLFYVFFVCLHCKFGLESKKKFLAKMQQTAMSSTTTKQLSSTSLKKVLKVDFASYGTSGSSAAYIC